MNIKFGYKLMLSYIALVLIPIFIIGYYSYYTSSTAVHEEAQSSMRQTLKQVVTNITNTQDEMKRAVDQLYFDQRFQSAIFNYTEGWEGYEAIDQEVVPRLNAQLAVTRYDIWLSVYTSVLPEKRNMLVPDNPALLNPLNRGKSYELFQLTRINTTSWYATYTHQSPHTGLWRQAGNDGQYDNISYIREITYFQNGSDLGLLRAVARLSDLFAAIEQMEIGTGSKVMVVDDTGLVRYTKGEQTLVGSRQQAMPNYLEVTENIPGLNWRVCVYIPMTTFYQKANRLRDLTILICAVLFCCMTVLGWYIARGFALRIDRISMALRDFQIGDFRQRISERRGDELAEIEAAFNDMASNVERLIHEMYVTNLKKKEAELNMLQAQINPHFLYNTLSAISRLAKFGELDKQQTMLLGLAKFYRLSLNDGHNFLPIHAEVEQIRAYLDIQKIKHGSDIEVHYEIDPTILDNITLKLVMQPFVENTLVHARFMGPLHVRVIAAREDDLIVFKIIDDGIGIDEEQLAKIQPSGAAQVGYGMRNVDQRIKLQFGKKYGVSVYSGLGIGTTVKITLPIVEPSQLHTLNTSFTPAPVPSAT